jgi:predicted GIY-YIG superfamily endonuclease
MTQGLLFADPRPLVERLGAEFFRQAPQCPGVYLMRDFSGEVVYVGKARNLRKRLSSYRMANPDRLRRRQLRLLRAVAQIDFQQCDSESSALAKESQLLQNLRPRFNRVGTWPGQPRFICWRVTNKSCDLTVAGAIEPGWHSCGPLGAGAVHLRAALVRLLWCALQPQKGLVGLPEGWFGGRLPQYTPIPRSEAPTEDFEQAEMRLRDLFSGDGDSFVDWIAGRTMTQTHPFEVAAREADLEVVVQFANNGIKSAAG